jgi:hypothetical protein
MGWQTGIPSILEIAGSPAAIFIYSPSPGAGNLIGSWASIGGTDQYGNAYPEGIFVAAGEITGPINIEIGMAGSSQISLLPGINAQFNITSVISGIMQAAMQLTTTDVNETVPGNIGSVILGSGSTAKMATVIGSPIGTASAAYIILESENDGGTDNSVITMGTVTSPDAGDTLVFTPVLTTGPTYLLLYSGAGGTQTVVTKTSGSGTIPIPASAISPGVGEAWGAGASTAGVSAGATTALGGNGSGAYAAEPSLVITPGGTVAYSVPASANSPGGSPPDCTLTGAVVTVTAHSGQAGTGASFGAGGAIGTNTIKFAGGSGGPRSTHTPNCGGGGGGGSAGPGGAGVNGAQGAPNFGGNGGAGAFGGAAGGNGGGPKTNGSPGAAPGGGGGGGGNNASGAIGAAGKVRLTYSTGTPALMLTVAASAGTDQFGTAYAEGIHFIDPVDTNNYSLAILRQTTTSVPTIGSTTAANLSGISIPVNIGTYYYRAVVGITEVAANSAFVVLGCTATGSIQGLVSYLSTTAVVKTQVAFANTGLNSAALVAGTTLCLLEGTITLTGGGVLTISLAASANANTFTVLQGAFLEIVKK